MIEIKRGMLLQYKKEFSGMYYPKLPKEPFSKDFRYYVKPFNLDELFMNVAQVWPVQGGAQVYVPPTLAGQVVITPPKPPHPFDSLGQTKKYILMVGKVVTVSHPKFDYPNTRTNYVMCLISDPANNRETIDGWVQDKWVEPLTETETLEEDDVARLKRSYLDLKKERGW